MRRPVSGEIITLLSEMAPLYALTPYDIKYYYDCQAHHSPKDWYLPFPNPVIAESVLDRLISSSHIITLIGKSYRSLLRPERILEKEVAIV
jgi:hypothetical protein